jgi:hypothetical protein
VKRKESQADNFARKIKWKPHLLGSVLGYEKLTDLHSDWIKECWDSAGSHGLMAFRGSYKTTSVVIIGIVRYFLFFPEARILLVRKTHEEACKVIKAVSKAFEKPELLGLFNLVHGNTPQKTIDKNNELLFNFKEVVTIEPSLTAKGIKDAVTGAHFDVIIADDIIGIQDRLSHAEREKVKESIRELAGNVIDPGALTIWLGTKWAKGDGWDVIETFTKVNKYPESVYNTFIPKEEIEEKQKRLTPFLRAINYELELTADESLLFSNPIYSDGWDFSVKNAVAHVDAAFDGDHFCALTIMAPLEGEGENTVYQAIGFTYPGHIEDWYDRIIEICILYRVKYLHEETNPDKGMSAKALTARKLTVKSYNESQNKHLKISTNLYRFWKRIKWAPESDTDYMSQVTDYKEGSEPDDAPDSAASLLREEYTKGGAAARAKYEW